MRAITSRSECSGICLASKVESSDSQPAPSRPAPGSTFLAPLASGARESLSRMASLWITQPVPVRDRVEVPPHCDRALGFDRPEGRGSMSRDSELRHEALNGRLQPSALG